MGRGGWILDFIIIRAYTCVCVLGKTVFFSSVLHVTLGLKDVKKTSIAPSVLGMKLLPHVCVLKKTSFIPKVTRKTDEKKTIFFPSVFRTKRRLYNVKQTSYWRLG